VSKPAGELTIDATEKIAPHAGCVGHARAARVALRSGTSNPEPAFF
jgi:hypothetical protein